MGTIKPTTWDSREKLQRPRKRVKGVWNPRVVARAAQLAIGESGKTAVK